MKITGKSVEVSNRQKEFSPCGTLMNKQTQKAHSCCTAKHVDVLVLSLVDVAAPSVVQ